MHVADNLTRLIEVAIDTACKNKWIQGFKLLGYDKAEVVGQHVVSASPENSSKPLWEIARIGAHWEGGSSFYSYVTIVMSAGISADAEVEQCRLPDLASTLELMHDAVGAGHHWKLSPGAARYDARTCDGNGGRGFLQHVNKMQITTTLATSTDWP